MKKNFKLFLAAALFAAVATITSCTKTCDAGYEGSDCKTEIRAKYVNEPNGWKVTETGTSSGAATYTVHIQTATTGITAIRITNVWNSFIHDVTGTADATALTIPRQNPDGMETDSGYYYVEGSGTLSGSTLTVNYKVTKEKPLGTVVNTDGFGLGSGTASTWTKQ